MFPLLIQQTEPRGFDLVPYVPIISVVIAGLIAGAWNIWNRRRGASETKQPTVSDFWNQLRAEERRRQNAERMYEILLGLYFDLRTAFKVYFRRQQEGGSKDLTESEKDAVDVTPPALED